MPTFKNTFFKSILGLSFGTIAKTYYRPANMEKKNNSLEI